MHHFQLPAIVRTRCLVLRGGPASIRCRPSLRLACATSKEDKVLGELMEMGFSREEAEVERDWDPNDVDPTSTFENMYSIDEEMPEDIRQQLTLKGHGPPVRSPHNLHEIVG
jgi:hypothetical protein